MYNIFYKVLLGWKFRSSPFLVARDCENEFLVHHTSLIALCKHVDKIIGEKKLIETKLKPYKRKNCRIFWRSEQHY